MRKTQASLIGCLISHLSISKYGLIAGLPISDRLPPSTNTFRVELLKTDLSRRNASGSINTAPPTQDSGNEKENDAEFAPKFQEKSTEWLGHQVRYRKKADLHHCKHHRHPSVGRNSLAAIGSSSKTGDATYYGTGLGACGLVSNDTSMVAAASSMLFDSFPGATDNPNLNPICGRKVEATYGDNSVQVTIVDRCGGCDIYDLDFSPSAFSKLASMEKGRLHGLRWDWI